MLQATSLRLAALACGTLAATAAFAQSDWHAVATDRFDVVSELGERDTRQWAEEFGQFVDALHNLLPLNQSLLPPLTAILFKRSGGFSRYRVRTESGLVGSNQAVFVHYGSWSVIGLPARSSSSDESSTTYHEAVHWFMRADPTRYPLWFSEGLAEAFSTFEVRGRYVRWGQSIPSHLRYLSVAGLQPMAEFLEVTQDQALHANATYYSQAWLFLHYLLFGRDGGPAELGRFLNSLQETTVRQAFMTSFGMEFSEMDRLLNSYLRTGNYHIGQAEIEDSDVAIQVSPAPPEAVEIALARLALGTNNPDVAAEHIERALEIDPMNAEAYDLLVVQRAREPDSDIEQLVDRAIDYGSHDASTFELKAALMLDALRKDDILFSTRAFEPEDARTIATVAARSIDLRPVNLNAFRLLTEALLCVDVATEDDRRILDLGSAIYPREGIVVLGQAALALTQNDTERALSLLDSALGGDYEFEDSDERGVEYLRDRLKRSLQ